MIRELGDGGSAKVYLVHERETGALQALKVLRDRYAARPDLRRRVLAEARTMASFDHPGLLSVFAWGIEGSSSPFIAMEYASGGSTRDWVRTHGAMPPRLAVQLAVQVTEALGVAHDRDVVHRDLKPDNVLLAADGSTRLADFGIARLADGEGLTRTDMTIGTVGYIPPEQFEDARSVDARADVYGLGATLWFWITGRVPAHVFHTDPWEAGVPSPLCRVLSRATAFQPAQRHTGMRALSADLRQALALLPPLPRDTPPLVPLRSQFGEP